MSDWLDKHTGPESSGSQEHEVDQKGGGSATPDYEKGGYHFTDWDDKGNRASWDERDGKVENHHVTPSKPEKDPVNQDKTKEDSTTRNKRR